MVLIPKDTSYFSQVNSRMSNVDIVIEYWPYYGLNYAQSLIHFYQLNLNDYNICEQ